MRKSLLLAAGLLLCSLASAQLKVVSPKMHGIDPSHLDRIDTLVVRNIHSGNIPGAVVAVVHGGDIVYLKAFGDKQVGRSEAAQQQAGGQEKALPHGIRRLR